MQPSAKFTLTRPLKTPLSDCKQSPVGQRGLEAAGIGRSKGGLTIARQSFACKRREGTKIHAAVDALGLHIRTIITPGQWGDSPQARGLIEGLTEAQHVIMDAAYDADHLRDFIADDLGATAHIK